MELDLAGQPLHTRALSVALRQRDDGALDAEATLLDLRKRSFVPVGGDLQGSGVIHHMQVRAAVAAADLEVREVEVSQPTVPFESSAATQGESCRDPGHGLQSLVGLPVDDGFASRLSAEVGGPRGCTHVLTAAQLLGATLPWALACDCERFPERPKRRPGERVFQRNLVFDGALEAESRIGLAAQLADLHFRPAPERARPLERFAGQLELRLRASVQMGALELLAVRAAERRRGPEDLDGARWRSLDEPLAGLEGLALRPGVSRALRDGFEGRPDERPLLAALLHLMPACYQCLAAASETWARDGRMDRGMVGLGGLPDSCYMWRRGGALDRARTPREEPS